MRFFLLFVLMSIFGVGEAGCQTINGIWRGKLTQEPGGCYPEYFIELQVQEADKGIMGYSYDYYDTTRFVKLTFAGRLNKTSKRVVFIEDRVVEYRIPKDCIPCIKTYDLTWSKTGNEESLSGTWKGTEMGSRNICPPGKISLKRVEQSAFKTEDPIQDQKLALVQNTSKLTQRKIEIVKTLVFDTSRIKVELYDNGQIDGDTISIYLNQQLFLYRQGLAEKPITFTLPIQPGKDYELIMYAENLGTIPPNTALMVVTAGKNKYEIYLSSSEVKSAAVRFRYEKKD